MDADDMMKPMRILVSVVFLASLCAAQDAAPAPKQARPEPKNLKVLKVSGAEIGRVMMTYTAGLGVQCNYCHQGRDFASDENPKKEIARTMITMSADINGKFSDGNVHVTCFTCHRGETMPKTAADPKPAQ